MRSRRFAEENDVDKVNFIVEMSDQYKNDKELKVKRSVDFSSVSTAFRTTKQPKKAVQIARLARSLQLQGSSSEKLKKSVEPIDQAAHEQFTKFKRSVDLLGSSSESMSDVSFARRREQHISKFKRNVNLLGSSSSDESFAPRKEQIAKFKRNVNLASSSSEDSSDYSFAPRNQEQIGKFKRSLDANDENSIAFKKLKLARSLISENDIDYKVEERAKRGAMSEAFKEGTSSFAENNVNKIIAKRSANEDVEQSIIDNKMARSAGISKCENNKVSKRSVCMDQEITANADETNKVSTSLHGNNDDNNKKMLVKREISAV